MVHRHHYSQSAGIFIILVVFLAACGSAPRTSSGSTPTTGTAATARGEATATANPAQSTCATQPTATAEAWVENNEQIMGNINGSAPALLSNFVYPLGLPHETDQTPLPAYRILTSPTWAPDGRHLAVLVGIGLGMGVTLYPYVVDTTTHAVKRVPLTDNAIPKGRDITDRFLAWADAHTLLILGGFGGGTGGSGGNQSSRYDIAQNTVTPLAGVTTAAEGVVRCTTLFYLEVTKLDRISISGIYEGAALLHRYDLATQQEIGNPVILGNTSTFDGAEGFVSMPGWDVSPDGTKLAYQQTSVSLSNTQSVIISSKFFVANADGSHPAPILDGATSNSPANLAISPDGNFVAVTNANPTPSVLSGSLSGGPAHYYQPNAEGSPVWLADSSAFEADNPLTSNALSIVRYPLNTGGGRAPGSLAHSNATSPSTLP